MDTMIGMLEQLNKSQVQDECLRRMNELNAKDTWINELDQL